MSRRRTNFQMFYHNEMNESCATRDLWCSHSNLNDKFTKIESPKACTSKWRNIYQTQFPFAHKQTDATHKPNGPSKQNYPIPAPGLSSCIGCLVRAHTIQNQTWQTFYTSFTRRTRRSIHARALCRGPSSRSKTHIIEWCLVPGMDGDVWWQWRGTTAPKLLARKGDLLNTNNYIQFISSRCTLATSIHGSWLPMETSGVSILVAVGRWQCPNGLKGHLSVLRVHADVILYQQKPNSTALTCDECI